MGAEANGAKTLIIAIDGPSGAGKGTIARALAARLRYRHVDTGAMYRAVAWKAIAEGLDLHDESAVAALSERARFDLEAGRVVIDGIGRVAGDPNAGDRRRGDDRGAASGGPARAGRPAAGHRPRRRRRHGRPRHRHGRVSRCRCEDLPRRVPRGTRPPPRQRSGASQLHGRGPVRGRDCARRARSQRLDPGGIAAAMAPDAILIETTGVGIESVVERVLAIVEERRHSPRRET